jgi:hypothetical protein
MSIPVQALARLQRKFLSTKRRSRRPAGKRREVNPSPPSLRSGIENLAELVPTRPGPALQPHLCIVHDETPKEHDGVPIPEKKISADQQSILIEADVPAVSANKGQTKSTPDHVSNAVPDNGTRCRCYSTTTTMLI